MLTDTSFRTLAEPVLAFANMRATDITTAKSVQQHFPWIRYRLPDSEAVAFIADHTMLVRQLGVLARRSGDADQVRKVTAKALRDEQHHVVGRLTLAKDGTPKVDLPHDTAIGVKTTCLLFLAELASRPGALRYFGRCRLDGCNVFFLKRGGRPGFYCCEKHQRRDNKRGQVCVGGIAKLLADAPKRDRHGAEAGREKLSPLDQTIGNHHRAKRRQNADPWRQK